MANPEHVETVSRGVEAITKWRIENPGKRLDLSGARLTLPQYHNAFLEDAELTNSKLFESEYREDQLIESLYGDEGVIWNLKEQLDRHSAKKRNARKLFNLIYAFLLWVVQSVLFGPKLVSSVEVFKINVKAWQSKQRELFPISEGTDVLIAGFIRFVRVGFIAFFIALIPLSIQIVQTSAMLVQNTKIQAQIDQFEEKNRKEERIRLEEILYDHAAGETNTNLRSRQNALLDFIKLEHDERRDMFGINMAHVFLKNLDMSRSRLQDKGIEGILNSATFLRADLENAKFFDTHLEEAWFLEANLKGAWFRNAHLEGAHFRGAFLGDVDFSGADLTGTHFDMAIVDSPDWIERLRKIQPPVKGFEFSLWSITEVKIDDGNSVFLITAPKDSKEHNLTTFNRKKLVR